MFQKTFHTEATDKDQLRCKLYKPTHTKINVNGFLEIYMWIVWVQHIFTFVCLFIYFFIMLQLTNIY